LRTVTKRAVVIDECVQHMGMPIACYDTESDFSGHSRSERVKLDVSSGFGS